MKIRVIYSDARTNEYIIPYFNMLPAGYSRIGNSNTVANQKCTPPPLEEGYDSIHQPDSPNPQN